MKDVTQKHYLPNPMVEALMRKAAIDPRLS